MGYRRINMSNTLPVTIQMGSLPPAIRATPQQLADMIAARLSLVTSQSFALFVAGSTAPTSNVGPWWKDDSSWYYWDVNSGSYKPQILAPASLGYTIGPSAPDPDIYSIWIETAVSGSPLSINIWYSGAWVNVYATQFSAYSTTTAMNAAIAAAVGGASFATYIAQAELGAPQAVNVDAAAHLIIWTAATINPAPAPFNITTSRYVAPAAGAYAISFTSQVSNNTGVAATMQAQIQVFKNGVATVFGAVDETPSPTYNHWFPSLTTQFIMLSVNDYLELWITCTDGTNTGSVNLEQTYWNILRVNS